MERQRLSNKLYIFGLIYWGFQELFLPAIVFYLMLMLGMQPDDVMLNFLYMTINLTVMVCLFAPVLKHDFRQLVQHPGSIFKYFGLGLAKYVGASTVTNLITMLLLPDFSNMNDATVGHLLDNQPLMMFVAIVILAPISEELLYRGVIYGCIRQKSKIAAYIVSASIFSLIHLISYISMADLPTLVISFIQYLPAGVALAYSYEKSGTLLCPIMIHMVANLLATTATR